MKIYYLKKTREEEDKLDKIKIEFEEFLLTDEDFLCCTNQKMRTYYMNNIIDNEKYKEYMKPFLTINMIGKEIEDRSSLWMFIESVWRKYKTIEKEQKQR